MQKTSKKRTKSSISTGLTTTRSIRFDQKLLESFQEFAEANRRPLAAELSLAMENHMKG